MYLLFPSHHVSTFLSPTNVADNAFGHICLCVCVCVSVCLPCLWPRNFIFVVLVRLQNIYVKCIYQGHWVEVKVTRAKRSYGWLIAMTLFRCDVDACKSKVWFSSRRNQSAGVSTTIASLSHGVDNRQNTLPDHENHEENTKDHCSRRSVSHGNTLFLKWSICFSLPIIMMTSY